MYLPRSLISKLYTHLQTTRHPTSPPVLILVALEPDALCGCRILTRLLKHDYIPHKIQPVAGYSDLEKAGKELVMPMMESQGGSGGVVVCLGVGGMVDLGPLLGLEQDGAEAPYSGVEVWVIDARRPWNLGNVFGGFPLEATSEAESSYQSRTPVGISGGQVERAYKSGKGGIVVFDDGDIEEAMEKERDAYLALVDMPDIDHDQEALGLTDDDDDDEDDDNDDGLDPELPRAGQKRKSWSDGHEDESTDDEDRPHQRRRSNSSSPIADSPRRPTYRGLVSLRGPEAGLSSDAIEPPSAAQEPPPPSARALRRRLLRLRQEKEAVLHSYYRMGSSFAEPISSMMYSLASELGRDDNDLLWLTIVGVTSMELYGRSSAGTAAPIRSNDSSRPSGWMGVRGARLRQLLRDEVRRLNPPEVTNGRVAPENAGVIPTTARNPEDTGIRLSPEPRFLLIRHWSLYDSMLHSPYLFSRLKTWSETGIKRLHKLLAKMGVSLAQCKQSYTHMDMMLKRELRAKLLKYGSLYNLDEMVPAVDTDDKDRAGAKDGWGFVRSWGWRATLSAQDVGVVIGALLEVGKHVQASEVAMPTSQLTHDAEDEVEFAAQAEEWVGRFWEAYDALEDIDSLKAGLPTAQFLHRAIYRTGTSLINKKQIKHLRAFRMCVVKDGPDVALFTHPAALTKLSLWIGEALAEQEREAHGKLSHGGRGTPLVVASLNEKRSVYIVVGTGGGGGPDTAFLNREAAKRRRAEREAKAKRKEAARLAKEKIREEKRAAKRAAGQEDDDEELETESEASDSGLDQDSGDDDDADAEPDKGYGLNKFGSAFQEVVSETNARVRIDSFEHCAVEVRKEDLGGFLESLSMKAVVG
ncbi:CDC45-like protein [Metarhizium robertsii]|uniref:CDC45-like protein n=2 Tax=Metarhizium robertsii TaxID=568076 RepID=E9F6R2_METRA|nr:CDC45-like protein [Metarhizium robertsii ARSEF 23]EFY96678.1 CDC45-like protein [Metarhizium robertsii ARSEF 23]EXU99007.1 CDC45-like protein [Metarhizium robertsii]